MRYMFSVIGSEEDAVPSPEDIAQIYKDVDAFNQELKTADAMIFATGLKPASSATTLRYSNGDITPMDGPYAETKEVLGGFWILRAENLDEALKLGERAARACHGTVEVRPLEDEPA